MAEVLTIDTYENFHQAVERAVALLKKGELVVLPTETVYGLAADGLNASAVSRIFEVKGRPGHNPIILHVAGYDMARRFAAEWNDAAEKLAKSFWPGPLTIVLPRAAQVPDAVTAGGETVGIRWSNHPFVQAVIQRAGMPLAAPSANLSNQVSPTNAGHVRKQIGDKIPLIIDGGPCQVGIESTVVDASVTPPRLLRPGMIHQESLMAVVGEIQTTVKNEGKLKSPGQLAKHYSPRASLKILEWRDDEHLARQLNEFGVELSDVHVISHSRIPLKLPDAQLSVIPHDPEAYARALYAEWHRCDETGARLIVMESLPETSEWQGIRDRLERASHHAPKRCV